MKTFRRRRRFHRRGTPGPRSWFRSCAETTFSLTSSDATDCHDSRVKAGIILLDPTVLQFAAPADQNVTTDTIRWPTVVSAEPSTDLQSTSGVFYWWIVVIRTGANVNDFVTNIFNLGSILLDEDVLDVRFGGFNLNPFILHTVSTVQNAIAHDVSQVPEDDRPWVIKSRRKLDGTERILALMGGWIPDGLPAGPSIDYRFATILSDYMHRSRA